MAPRSGFTLFDTLIGIVLLELALLGLLGALSSGERLLARGRLATRAAAQGRELLARFARSDTVCTAAIGLRTFPDASITWEPADSASLRRVTAVIARRGSAAAAESLATLVYCP